jgi:dolichyl-phosphate-mannose-protein mannosyltransferase
MFRLRSQKLILARFPWLAIALTGIFLLSIALRFWRLGQFNKLVFDEVYFAKFAVDYLRGIPFFDAHPPLGKYCIALGVWLSQFFPIDRTVSNSLTGLGLNPIAYRWLNALVGAGIPVVVGGIAYQLSRRRSYAILAAFCMAIEGMVLVESRYALLNVYLLLFGLLGHWFYLSATDRVGVRKSLYLTAAGIFCGASAAVKWNGLGFLGGIYALYVMSFGVRLFDRKKAIASHSSPQLLPRLNILSFLVYFAILPALIYYLTWLPHLQLNPDDTLRSLHAEILAYHQSLGTGKDVHPYCSAWYTWPLMLRPVSYLYGKIGTGIQVISHAGTSVPGVVYCVHFLSNPVLFWSSTIAIIILFSRVIWMGVDRSIAFFRTRSDWRSNLPFPKEFYSFGYILTNYFINFLPWSQVSRCMFIYTYMSSLMFAILAIAWILDRGLYSRYPIGRILSTALIFLMVMAFIFWLPLYLGLPLSPIAWQHRMWLGSWR